MVAHADSLEKASHRKADGVRWMTAGSGIVHREMPSGNATGQMHGFQRWANLPVSLKMTAPRCQDVDTAHIREIIDGDGTRVKTGIGEFWGRKGPVDGMAADPLYPDIEVPAGLPMRFRINTYRNSFACVFKGKRCICACRCLAGKGNHGPQAQYSRHVGQPDIDAVWRA